MEKVGQRPSEKPSQAQGPDDRPVYIVTGASRGLGAAIASALADSTARPPCRLVLTARTASDLESLVQEINRIASGLGTEVQTAIMVVGDVVDSETGRECVRRALEAFGRLDGLVLNHGVVEPVERVGEVKVEEWRECMEVNFFSMLHFVRLLATAL